MADDKYLAKLRTHWKRHAAFPSMAKLCETLGLTSTSSVFALVGRLVDAGYLERVEGRIVPTKKFFAHPLMSPVRAGVPQPASQEETDVLTIDDYLIDFPNRTSMAWAELCLNLTGRLSCPFGPLSLWQCNQSSCSSIGRFMN